MMKGSVQAAKGAREGHLTHPGQGWTTEGSGETSRMRVGGRDRKKKKFQV